MSVEGDPDTPVTGLSCYSDRAVLGDLFFCIPKEAARGRAVARRAVHSGAVAVCAEQPTEPGVPQLVVTDVRRAMARIAARFYGNPGEDLLLLGVTGTNGKTTTVYLLEAILAAAGHRPGLISTIETRFADQSRPSLRTTPGSLGLQRLLAEFRADGADSAALEVSSHALELHRVEALTFACAIFTNLAEDHLDFHGDMEKYFRAKQRLFDDQRVQRAASNIDDSYGRRLKETAPVPCVGFGFSPEAEVRAEQLAFGPNGSEFLLVTPEGEIEVRTPLLNAPSVSNCLAAAAGALQAGIGLTSIQAGLASVRSLPHRLEVVAEVDGVKYVDDSKSTNAHATLAAVRGMANVVLIAGGRSKGADLSALATSVQSVSAVITLGEAANEIERLFADAVPVERALSMHDAVHRAEQRATSGDCVLLSPACASFDMYESYAARGDEFAREVRHLAEPSATGAIATAGRPGRTAAVAGRSPDGVARPVVAAALSQVGRPYRWGGYGRKSYDCSGLTMLAWAHAGVCLPHNAEEQYEVTARVAQSDWQPGDLLFFGSPVSHVGLYVGEGRMAEAARGEAVKLSSAYRRDYVGAGRPGADSQEFRALLDESITASEVARSLVAIRQRRGRAQAKLALRVAKDMLKAAQRQGKVVDETVFTLRAPARDRSELRILSAREVDDLASQMAEPYRRLILTAAATGLRQGELFALRERSIDFVGGTLRVESGAYDGEIRPPRSRASRRSVILSEEATELLREQLVRRPPNRLGLVFPDRKGGVLRQHKFGRYAFRPAARRTGLEHVSFRDLRHTYAAGMIEAGADPETLQAQLGHASVRTTLELYAGLFEEVGRARP